MVNPAVVAEKGGEASGISLAEHPLLADVEILAVREGGEVICMMPTDRIDHEDVPVKTEWAGSLARQMRKLAALKGGSGQKSTITLGVVEGESRAKIADGFHREAALLEIGEPFAFASIEYMDWDGLYDHRIITAKDHVHVRFSRVVEWMNKVWQYSGLADKMTIEQAVLMYTFETPGSRLGLEPEDVEAAKAWVARKEEQWEMSAMTFHGYLVTAQNVDPRLVHTAREKKHGKALEAPTQSILKVFSQMLPNQFDLQNLVMQAAMAHNLRSPEVRALCRSVAHCGSLEDATNLIVGIDWGNWEPEYAQTKTRALRRAHDVRYKGGATLDKSSQDIRNVLNRLSKSMEQGEELTPAMRAQVEAARSQAIALHADVGELIIRLSEFVGMPVPRATNVAVGKATVQAAKSSSGSLLRNQVLTPEAKPQAPEKAVNEAPETGGDLGEEFDPEDELDDERFVVEEDRDDLDEEEPDIVCPEDLFDADRFDPEDDDNNDEGPDERPSTAQSSVRQLIPPQETPETTAFKEGLRAYLNSTSRPRPPLPSIDSKLHITLAESLLRRGAFSGHPDLQEDVRDAIDRTRRRLVADTRRAG